MSMNLKSSESASWQELRAEKSAAGAISFRGFDYGMDVLPARGAFGGATCITDLPLPANHIPDSPMTEKTQAA